MVEGAVFGGVLGFGVKGAAAALGFIAEDLLEERAAAVTLAAVEGEKGAAGADGEAL